MTKFAPSLLAADFSNLRGELDKVASADYLHLDIMDGKFVPNITFGPGLIDSIRSCTSLTFDTHLMIEEPEKYIEDFARAGSNILTVHQEATLHLDRVINQIKDNNCQAGVSLNPATPLITIEDILPELDQVLIMSVNPGFGGQAFIPRIYDKIKNLDQIISENSYDVRIAVDGGINLQNIEAVVEAGTDIIVAGSAIFKSKAPEKTLAKMRNMCDG